LPYCRVKSSVGVLDIHDPFTGCKRLSAVVYHFPFVGVKWNVRRSARQLGSGSSSIKVALICGSKIARSARVSKD
jgi:hypothetical protein